MCKVVRNILPVGQGAFYVEKLYIRSKTYTIVYDCGSQNGKRIVDREINKNFKDNEEIDAVFISHFHADHISGLYSLIEKCKVKNLFLPLITESSSRLVDLLIAINVDTDEYEANLLQTIINKVEKLYYVRSSENTGEIGENFNIREKIDVINSGEDVFEKIGEKLGNRNPWLLIPYNFEQEENYEKFKKLVEDKLGEKIEDIDINKENIEKIKEGYCELGNMNANSMTLFSGQKESSNHYCYCDYCCDYPWVHICNWQFITLLSGNVDIIPQNGCLYTGDYSMGNNKYWKDLEKKYSDYLDNLGLVQIPHHGSDKDFNEKLYDNLKCSNYFISVGEENGYKHPGEKVIGKFEESNKLSMFKNRKKLNIVTEDSGTEVCYCSYFSLT